MDGVLLSAKIRLRDVLSKNSSRFMRLETFSTEVGAVINPIQLIYV